MLDAPPRIYPTLPAHLGTAGRFCKRMAQLLGQARYHDPNGCVLEVSQMSSWQKHPQNHGDIEGLIQGWFWGHRSVYAKPQPVASRLWSMPEYAPPHVMGNPSNDPSHTLPPLSGALYRKFGHLPLFPILSLPPPLLTCISTQIPHPPLPP